jgi:hypothetical protein
MSDQLPDDEPFAERVARVLRAPERFDEDFEASLVAAIRADPTSRRERAPRPWSRAWWTAPMLRIAPATAFSGALAAAALFVVAVAIGRHTAPRTPPEAAHAVAAASVHDTVTLVRFVFVGRAHRVSLVGDFNGWDATRTQLAPAGHDGTWVAAVPVPKGRHEYAFIVDGTQWVADPFAATSADDFDTTSSIITVGD